MAHTNTIRVDQVQVLEELIEYMAPALRSYMETARKVWGDEAAEALLAQAEAVERRARDRRLNEKGAA